MTDNGEGAMGERRLLFNYARHYHLNCYEPPISMEDARGGGHG